MKSFLIVFKNDDYKIFNNAKTIKEALVFCFNYVTSESQVLARKQFKNFLNDYVSDSDILSMIDVFNKFSNYNEEIMYIYEIANCLYQKG